MRTAILASVLGVALGLSAPARGGVDVTIEGDFPDTTNCIPFGGPPPPGGYAGFIYQHVPPFMLAAGDLLSFDTLVQNDQPIVVDIALAAAAANGSHVPRLDRLHDHRAERDPSPPQ